MNTARLITIAAAFALTDCAAPATQQPIGGSRDTTSMGRRAEAAYVRSIYGPTWTLTHLGGAEAPAGNRGRPATLIFYSGTDRRANGFAGCNQWTSSYELTGRDSIGFGPPTSTRMACAEGMDLETRFLRFLKLTKRGSQRDSTLVLFNQLGDSAKFVAR